METKLRSAIIGTGGIANAHANAIAANRDAIELVAVMDVDAERGKAFAEKHGNPAVYSDTAELLAAERIDIAHICTPPKFHADLCIQAMEAGAWVLCEKPLCGSLRDTDRILAAEARTGMHMSVVFQFRYGAATRHLLAARDAGLLGRPLVGVCHTLWYRDAGYYAVDWRGTWASELGGCTVGHGIHAMDHFLQIMGPWTSITARAATLDRAIEVDDVSMAMVTFESGAVGSIVNSILCPRQETYSRFDFQRTTAEVRHLYGYTNQDWTFTPAPGNEALLEKLTAFGSGEKASHVAQLRQVIAAKQAGEQTPSGGAAARETMELLTAIYKSAITGQSVAKGSIVDGDPFYDSLNGGQSLPPVNP